MVLPLSEAPTILRAAGLTVVVHAGFSTRSRTDGSFNPKALIIHHDASALGPSPGVPEYMMNPANNGAQFWVDMLGVWHCLAAGRMWHAGSGEGWGVIRAGLGNVDSAGVETDHTIGEDWPAVQLASMIRGSAALCQAYGWNPANAVCGHKEYTKRKPDPHGIVMSDFRRSVAAVNLQEVPEVVMSSVQWEPSTDHEGEQGGVPRWGAIAVPPVGGSLSAPKEAWVHLRIPHAPAQVHGLWFVNTGGTASLVVDDEMLTHDTYHRWQLPAGTVQVSCLYSSTVPIAVTLEAK